MHSTEYLYGCSQKDFYKLPYDKALKYKLDAGRDLLCMLYYTDNKTAEEHTRQFYVQKAIRHTEKMIEELCYD